MREPDNIMLQQGRPPEFLSTANIESVQTEYEVLHLMRQCASHFGFSHFLVSRFPANAQQRFTERLLVSNWPSDLVRKYDAMNLFHLSRLAIETGMTKLPVQGDSALFAPSDWESTQAGEAIALAEGHGLAASTAFLLHSTTSDPYLMVLSGERLPLSRPELAELHFAALQLFECLEKTFVAATAGREKLSGRELECLRWAAAGKSSDREIAEDLGQDLAVERLQQEVVGAGALAHHHLLEIGLDDAIVDAHRLALRQVADIADKLQRTIHRAIDDDDVRQFGFAAHQRLERTRSFQHQKIKPGKNTLADLTDDIRTIGDHQPLHLLLLGLPPHETRERYRMQLYLRLANKALAVMVNRP